MAEFVDLVTHAEYFEYVYNDYAPIVGPGENEQASVMLRETRAKANITRVALLTMDVHDALGADIATGVDVMKVKEDNTIAYVMADDGTFTAALDSLSAVPPIVVVQSVNATPTTTTLALYEAVRDALG